MEEQEELLGGNGVGIRVSTFDYSGENHFKEMDMISKLCGEVETDSVDETEIQCYKSSITFLSEWKLYKYNPRIIRFACEMDNSLEKCVLNGINLPQFSSATVPKERADGGASSLESCKDFVMYVGGSVWALDWCPRVHERPDNHIKREFVAISAHPPESYYHKIGVPLTGRGIVQIWCVLNVSGDEEVLPMKKSKLGARYNVSKMDKSVELNRPKGRPRKKPIEESSRNEATKALVKMPKGRPRKRPIEESPINEAMELVLAKRPKGRPRKKPIEESPSNEATEEILAPVNEATKENSAQVKRRGRPRQNPTNESLDSLGSSNQYVQALSVEYPQDSPGLLTIEGISQNSQDEAKQKCKVKLKKSFTKKLSNLKTTAQSRRLKSNARKGSDSGDVACPQLLTHNEDDKVSLDINSSSSVNYQTDVNSGLSTALPAYGSDNVSLDINSTSYIPKDADLPRVVLCLAHNGKVAWDVKWQPCNSPPSKCQHRMGYLAVLLGNGSLEVWDVPLPHAMKSVYSSSNLEGTDPRFVKIKPVFRCSTLKCGGFQSIPLVVEWSTSYPHDYLLAGCHDGTVALWKFSASGTSGDTRPLLCFSADTVPIRAIAWAPSESDQESPNLFLTAGHLGLKFWDIRDPFRPLWDLHPAPKLIYSLDWLPDPRCIILSFDDGTMRLFSLAKAAYDAAVNGKPSVGPKQLGMHVVNCSSFAIWSVQVSRLTGMVAYCSADGTVCRFQLTTKAVEKDPSRHRAPHFGCGSLSEDESAIIVGTPLPYTPLPLKKLVNDVGNNPKSKQPLSVSNKTAKIPTSNDLPLALCYGDDPGMDHGSDETLTATKSKSKPKSKSGSKQQEGEDQALVCIDDKQDEESGKEGAGNVVESIPPKMVAVHRVRWNMNKGSERWLCSGGAAGIVRCQEIKMSDADICSARKR
ncbi:RNA polymerase III TRANSCRIPTION INITIATION FACTOR COMPLEX SUBUNIT [Salix purpurea]|uniref:RNA polymerase III TRANSCRIPTION INITIATION FACTOR COMPLEX SUBUNIT n=1 Tax=Salix purpurea TaxID=77065 RepID=A0A9Q0U8H4_SALPP|nr:RNA polymerase III TRANSCRIPTION INITIATION FACTOR COMPLEX SUBUNIT [Salix purpurea]